MSLAEIKALRQLHNNANIIIKKGDKGAGIVVMDRVDYQNKIEDMLKDTDTYTELEKDITGEIKLLADIELTQLLNNNYINKKQFKSLTNFIAECPKFYGVPKIHKKTCPLRPIVSQMNGPTRKIHDLLDAYLETAEKNIPYLLQDTTAFINLLKNKQHLITNKTILVTLDVVSLYTNIPQIEGAKEVGDFYEEAIPNWSSPLKPITKQELINLLLFSLQNTVFTFNSKYYKQNYGCSMGAQSSVKFANIFMHKFLQKFRQNYKNYLPDFFARLVDDVFTLWNADLDSLLLFVEALNKSHKTIKFELKYSYTDIQFLDTIVYIENNILKTKLYIKPTDKKQYLHYTSSHPTYTKTAIPYSQALRYRRIISDDDILRTELESLQHKFTARQYPLQNTQLQLNRILTIPREQTLRYKTKLQKQQEFAEFVKGDTFLPCVVTFHPTLYINKQINLKTTLKDKWQSLLNNNRELKDIFADNTPQLVFKKHKTLATYLTSAAYPPRWLRNGRTRDTDTVNILAQLLQENMDKPVEACKHPRCLCCNSIRDLTYINKLQPNLIVQHETLTCNSKNIIYLIHCNKCKLNYIGETKRSLKERLNNHRSAIKTKKLTAISVHFNLPQHNFNNLEIMPFEHIPNATEIELQTRENFWIHTLNTIYPCGINFYPLINTVH